MLLVSFLCAIHKLDPNPFSVINEAPTRLDTADLGMWRAAGLLLDDQGFVIPNDSQENASNEPFASRGMQEDMISNALIWLLSKIVNYTVYEFQFEFSGLANKNTVMVIPLIMFFHKIG